MKPIRITDWGCFFGGHDWKYDQRWIVNRRWHLELITYRVWCRRCHWEDTDTWEYFTTIRNVVEAVRSWFWRLRHPGQDEIPF